jgi:hypothetical protein
MKLEVLMLRIRPRILIPVILMVIMAAIFVWPTPVGAQCGTQASSCKNCHEVQSQDSVSAKGDWHIQHAFGDFCEFCHAGNVTATDKDAAHTGMVPPMADIKTSCQQCHTADLTEKAQVYATELGITLDSGGGGAAPSAPTSAPTSGGSPANNESPTTEQVAVSALASNQLVIDDPNVTDYVQLYDEIVLGKRPVNRGNVILSVLIGLIVVGGGGFVIVNETRISLSGRDTKNLEQEYPAEVMDMLPAIAVLKPETRKSLKNLLDNPEKADKALGQIDEAVSDKEPEE